MTADRSDLLKLLAVISMSLDHIGLFFYPGSSIFRILGRLALPIFAFYLVQGYRYTRSIYWYGTRLFVFAIISQIPFYLLQVQLLNIYFTLLLGLFALMAYDRYGIVAAFAVALVGQAVNADYGAYCILMILFFYMFENKRWQDLFVQSAIAGVYSYFREWWIQIFVIPWILLMNVRMPVHIRLPRYFFYVFYPAHLLIIWAIQAYFRGS